MEGNSCRDWNRFLFDVFINSKHDQSLSDELNNCL